MLLLIDKNQFFSNVFSQTPHIMA